MGLVNFIMTIPLTQTHLLSMYFKGKAYTFSWSNSYIFILFCLPPLEVLNGKNYRIKFFLSRVYPILEAGAWSSREANMKSQKLSPFVNMAVKTAFAKLSVSNTVNSNIKSSLPIMVIFIMGNTGHSKLQTKVWHFNGSTIFCFYTSCQAGKRWLSF